MDTDELPLEERCENLMQVVVESRKQFGKMCVDYAHKTSLLEIKMVYMQVQIISNSVFKPKNPLPNINAEDMWKDIDGFADEIMKRKQRMENLKKKVKDTKDIVHQLKRDSVGRKMHRPLTAEAMLTHAKRKRKLDNNMVVVNDDV